MDRLAEPPGEKFTRNDRLLRRREFDAVYSRGERIPSPHFTVFILPNILGRSRLGVTLSRKIGGAVVRNRTRRRLREIFRRQPSVRASGLDIVVHGRPELARLPARRIERELLGAIERFRRRRKKGKSR